MAVTYPGSGTLREDARTAATFGLFDLYARGTMRGI